MQVDVARTPQGWPARVRCGGCSQELEIHQPDHRQPDRLLGTCEACGRWVMLNNDPKEGHLVTVTLPEKLDFHDFEMS